MIHHGFFRTFVTVMLIKTRAIVLHTFKYGDAKLVIELLTEKFGRLSFMSRIPKTAKGKLKKQFFQPLTLLEIEFDMRQRGGLQTMRDARIALPFVSIPFEPVKLSLSLFVAEFLYYATRSEQENTPLFNYLINCIEWLDNSRGAFANFHLVFTLRLSRFLGFYPNLEASAATAYFDLRNGCFTATMPSHADFLLPSEAARIGLLMRMNFDTMHLFRMSHHERNRCIELILMFYQLHVPGFPELKSLGVLQELFA